MSAVLNRPTFLDVAETAEFLRVEQQTLANWRATGRHGLPFTRVGRKVLYRLDHLEKWLASRTVGTIPGDEGGSK